jgi:hypothetical protein
VNGKIEYNSRKKVSGVKRREDNITERKCRGLEEGKQEEREGKK